MQNVISVKRILLYTLRFSSVLTSLHVCAIQLANIDAWLMIWCYESIVLDQIFVHVQLIRQATYLVRVIL